MLRRGPNKVRNTVVILYVGTKIGQQLSESLIVTYVPFYPLISLDWAYVESFKGLSIDLYEKCRREGRREKGQLKIPARIRANILVEDWECSLSSVIRASQQTDAVRMERSKTAKQSIKQLRREDKMKSAIKPFKIVLKKLRRNKQRVFSDLKNLETFSDSSSRKDEEDLTFF